MSFRTLTVALLAGGASALLPTPAAAQEDSVEYFTLSLIHI